MHCEPRLILDGSGAGERAGFTPDSRGRSERVGESATQVGGFRVTARDPDPIQARARMKSNCRLTARTRLDSVRTVWRVLGQAQAPEG